MDKHEIASILDEMGTLLALKGGNPFRIRAYHNAARAIENLGNDLEKLVEEKELENIPGIGEKIAKKITTLMQTGHLPAFEKLKKSIPPALLEMLTIPGLGSKKVKVLYEKLKIHSIEDLVQACQKGKVSKLAGFGTKTQTNLLNEIAKLKTYGKRTLLWNAAIVAEPIIAAIKKCKWVKKVEIAGSFRRALETVGDLDILVSSPHPAKVIEWFVQQPWIQKIIAKGPTKASVRIKDEMQVDLRALTEKEYSFGLLYFTGSKEHNIQLRLIAREKGYSLSEYGFEPLDKKHRTLLSKKFPSEKAIYQSLGLCYIPPEIRENMGEIEAAQKNKIPHLIEEKDLRGLFHLHTTSSDGHNTLEEMIEEAQHLGFEYIGISDHSKAAFQANGLTEEALYHQIQKIGKINRSKKFFPYVFSGVECDILKSGKLDLSSDILKKLDFVIVSIHSSFQLDEKTQTARLIKAIENPYTTMVGHLTGRLLLQREPYRINTTKIIDACIANHKVMELNCHPMRLDMDWRLWHRAQEKGLKACINPDAHRIEDLQYYQVGIRIARKGWLRKQDVLNTLSLAKMSSYLKKK